MRQVSFPNGTVRCRPGIGLTFRVNLDDCLVICDVSLDVLRGHFGAPSSNCDALVDTFERHRARIEEVARAHLELSERVTGVHLTPRHFKGPEFG